MNVYRITKMLQYRQVGVGSVDSLECDNVTTQDPLLPSKSAIETQEKADGKS
jgi:hypothetical protein